MYNNLGAASRDDGRQYRYSGIALLKFREALDNYQLEDVVWDPYRDKKDSAHAFKEVTFFYVALATPYHVQHYYPNRVVRQFNQEQCIPAKRLLTEHQEHASLSLNAHNTMPTRGRSDGFDQQITKLNDQLQKLKKDKKKKSETNTKLRDALKEKTSEYDLLKEGIKKMKENIQLKQCKNLKVKNTSLEAELSVKKSESIKVVNTLLMEQIDLHLPPATPPVPYVTLEKKYDDLLAAHKGVKKKLIVKENFRKKLVNAEERMKSLEVNNSEWFLLQKVWHQALKKALASEGMGDMGDPTFE
ncbi:hypothetical protein GIB67_036980 [Kingdonia uniflora]|uniref:Aminotransferase-like plant mobile domain-containing protein n=1 Tax=Kingdonia uniflora TaxID=39325 RepID=A0A7J7NWE3_9MAGN|nr:hypothetical protein GIB67_036980 [Kingdonia uniflora]